MTASLEIPLALNPQSQLWDSAVFGFRIGGYGDRPDGFSTQWVRPHVRSAPPPPDRRRVIRPRMVAAAVTSHSAFRSLKKSPPLVSACVVQRQRSAMQLAWQELQDWPCADGPNPRHHEQSLRSLKTLKWIQEVRCIVGLCRSGESAEVTVPSDAQLSRSVSEETEAAPNLFQEEIPVYALFFVPPTVMDSNASDDSDPDRDVGVAQLLAAVASCMTWRAVHLLRCNCDLQLWPIKAWMDLAFEPLATHRCLKITQEDMAGLGAAKHTALEQLFKAEGHESESKGGRGSGKVSRASRDRKSTALSRAVATFAAALRGGPLQEFPRDSRTAAPGRPWSTLRSLVAELSGDVAKSAVILDVVAHHLERAGWLCCASHSALFMGCPGLVGRSGEPMLGTGWFVAANREWRGFSDPSPSPTEQSHAWFRACKLGVSFRECKGNQQLLSRQNLPAGDHSLSEVDESEDTASAGGSLSSLDSDDGDCNHVAASRTLKKYQALVLRIRPTMWRCRLLPTMPVGTTESQWMSAMEDRCGVEEEDGANVTTRLLPGLERVRVLRWLGHDAPPLTRLEQENQRHGYGPFYPRTLRDYAARVLLAQGIPMKEGDIRARGLVQVQVAARATTTVPAALLVQEAAPIRSRTRKEGSSLMREVLAHLTDRHLGDPAALLLHFPEGSISMEAQWEQAMQHLPAIHETGGAELDTEPSGEVAALAQQRAQERRQRARLSMRERIAQARSLVQSAKTMALAPAVEEGQPAEEAPRPPVHLTKPRFTRKRLAAGALRDQAPLKQPRVPRKPAHRDRQMHPTGGVVGRAGAKANLTSSKPGRRKDQPVCREAHNPRPTVSVHRFDAAKEEGSDSVSSLDLSDFGLSSDSE